MGTKKNNLVRTRRIYQGTTGVVVTPEGNVMYVPLNNLQERQAAVGGYIEAVPPATDLVTSASLEIDPRSFITYVDEDGRSKGLLPNRHARRFYAEMFGLDEKHVELFGNTLYVDAAFERRDEEPNWNGVEPTKPFIKKIAARLRAYVF